MQAPPRPTRLALGQLEREVVREGVARDELRRRHDERARLDRDVAHRRDPAVRVVGCGRDPDLRAALVDRPARQRHAVLPADQAADPADRRLDRRRGRRPRRCRGRAARGGSASACGASRAGPRGRSGGARCRACRAARPRARSPRSRRRRRARGRPRRGGRPPARAPRPSSPTSAPTARRSRRRWRPGAPTRSTDRARGTSRAGPRAATPSRRGLAEQLARPWRGWPRGRGSTGGGLEGRHAYRWEVGHARLDRILRGVAFSIAQVTPWPWEQHHEVNRFVERLSDELCARGHRVVVVAPSDSRELVREGRATVERSAPTPTRSGPSRAAPRCSPSGSRCRSGAAAPCRCRSTCRARSRTCSSTASSTSCTCTSRSRRARPRRRCGTRAR